MARHNDAIEPPQAAASDDVAVDQWIADQVSRLTESELLMIKGVLDDLASHDAGVALL